MYAAGDELEPDAGSVDYLEDLVVEFMSDLVCFNVPVSCLGQPIVPTYSTYAASTRTTISADSPDHDHCTGPTSNTTRLEEVS